VLPQRTSEARKWRELPSWASAVRNPTRGSLVHITADGTGGFGAFGSCREAGSWRPSVEAPLRLGPGLKDGQLAAAMEAWRDVQGPQQDSESTAEHLPRRPRRRSGRRGVGTAGGRGRADPRPAHAALRPRRHQRVRAASSFLRRRFGGRGAAGRGPAGLRRAPRAPGSSRPCAGTACSAALSCARCSRPSTTGMTSCLW
jgi:hypothetical protein